MTETRRGGLLSQPDVTAWRRQQRLEAASTDEVNMLAELVDKQAAAASTEESITAKQVYKEKKLERPLCPRHALRPATLRANKLKMEPLGGRAPRLSLRSTRCVWKHSEVNKTVRQRLCTAPQLASTTWSVRNVVFHQNAPRRGGVDWTGVPRSVASPAQTEGAGQESRCRAERI